VAHWFSEPEPAGLDGLVLWATTRAYSVPPEREVFWAAVKPVLVGVGVGAGAETVPPDNEVSCAADRPEVLVATGFLADELAVEPGSVVDVVDAGA